jgi:hypothetical protein
MEWRAAVPGKRKIKSHAQPPEREQFVARIFHDSQNLSCERTAVYNDISAR